MTGDFRSEKLPRGLYPSKVFRVVVEITCKATETVTLPAAFPAEVPVDLLMQRRSSVWST